MMLIKHFKDPEILDDVDPEILDDASNALIILDDVDNLDQVDALLPFGPSSGSLILITSRDKHVLRSSKVEMSSIYNLTGLNDQHSRELFCSYAFNQTYPHPEFVSLVDRFVEACNGLPLSLKVFGANLYGRDISYWEEELGSFPSEIKDRLEISYNALNKEEQQIFLDTACFFRGQNRDTAISIWNESGWKGRRGFQNLQDKCLVEVDSSNVIHMHDQVRDMGRDLAEKSSPHRLWRWTQNVIDLLEQSSVITARGIKMDLSEYNDYGDELGRIGTRRLKILDTQDCVLESILRRAELPSILWLRWVNCPYSSLPSWIPMKNLRFLEVSGTVLNTLWKRESESQLPVFLEVLNTQSCVTLNSITGLEKLTKLRKLNIMWCSDLEMLPGIEALVSLEGLWATGCVQLKSITGLEQLTKLQKLNVAECSELEELPSIERLVHLEELRANGCVKLKSIRGLAQLTKLRILNVSGCSELEEVEGVEHCTWLDKLNVSRCSKITLPCSFVWIVDRPCTTRKACSTCKGNARKA